MDILPLIDVLKFHRFFFSPTDFTDLHRLLKQIIKSVCKSVKSVGQKKMLNLRAQKPKTV